MEKLKFKQIMSLTLTLFAIFFGAGNMVFPPAMGQLAGENYWQALIGFMPKLRRNRTMGIKLPWTLQSEENWTRTHRLSGFLWVLCGLVMIPLSLLRLWSGWLFGALLAVMVLIPAVYSYALHRKGI